ncbi:hypothetical protein [Sphingomonas sp.]|uniref:hypothetical protein n=1 Tax=Sphingomonas sp. TaxID=28214 RepID=UPI002D1729A8|nr:hypothetical protein [Sphingomonas sp.]HTG38844.1 hypothetical protein [Sphingomonas sp.]
MADTDTPVDNEIMAAAKDARGRRSATDANPPPATEGKRWPIATVAGIGIGSAALAAALIYTRKRD